MSFLDEGNNNDNNVHIFRDKDLYHSYNLQHSLLARERSLTEQSHKTATIMSMIKSHHIDLIRFMESLNMKTYNNYS